MEDEEAFHLGVEGLDTPTNIPRLGPADQAWLHFMTGRHDVKKSLLEDIFRLVKVGLPTLFRSATSYSRFVDALPGLDFRETSIPLEGTSPVLFAWRSIVDVVNMQLEQHNGHFLDPIDSEMSPLETDFIHGERFRRLQAQLCEQAGPDAVLLPILLNSGYVNFGVFACVVFVVYM